MGQTEKKAGDSKRKKSFVDRKKCEAIVCNSGVIREILPRLNRIVLLSCLGKN